MGSHDSLQPARRPADARLAAPRPDYRSAWADLRRRQRWFFGEWLGGFAAIVVVCTLAKLLGPAAQQLAIAILAPVWVIGFVVLGLRLQMFPCPRCHCPFFFRFFYWSGFLVSTCRHCGLPKWATTDCRTPGTLFAWYPPDDEPAADSSESLGEQPSPYDAMPCWCRRISGLMQISAALIAIATIIEFAAATRWLMIEWRQGAEQEPLFGTLPLTLGQALLAGGIVQVIGAVLLWLAAGRMQRPWRPRQS